MESGTTWPWLRCRQIDPFAIALAPLGRSQMVDAGVGRKHIDGAARSGARRHGHGGRSDTNRDGKSG
jgi:hypothetical protein